MSLSSPRIGEVFVSGTGKRQRWEYKAEREPGTANHCHVLEKLGDGALDVKRFIPAGNWPAELKEIQDDT